MDSVRWYRLSFEEQMSNIHGEVKRLVRARNNYNSGVSVEDHSKSYVEKIHSLIELTCSDPKNARRQAELREEEGEIGRWLTGEVDDRYILRYWEQYTNAIS